MSNADAWGCKALDAVEHIHPGAVSDSIILAYRPFRRRIVPDISGPGHRAGSAVVGREALELPLVYWLLWSG